MPSLIDIVGFGFILVVLLLALTLLVAPEMLIRKQPAKVDKVELPGDGLPAFGD